MKLWLNIASAGDGFSAADLAHIARTAAPLDVHSLLGHGAQVIGRVVRYECRGDHLWAEVELDDDKRHLLGRRSAAALLKDPPRVAGIMTTNLSRDHIVLASRGVSYAQAEMALHTGKIRGKA